MKLKLSTVTIKLKLPIAALLLGAGLTACTPQPDSNIVEDNMEFAQQQLRCAFDEIDYAVANESPESRAQREKNGWTGDGHFAIETADGGHSPIPGIRNRTGRFTSSRPKTGPADSSPASSGFSMSIPRIISGKRRRSNIPISWNRKR